MADPSPGNELVQLAWGQNRASESAPPGAVAVEDKKTALSGLGVVEWRPTTMPLADPGQLQTG